MRLKKEYIRLKKDQRLYKLEVPVIALSGGIATGKSTVAKKLKSMGLPIIDADQLVKDIYALPETISFIKKEYPEVIKNNSIHFPLLREIFFSNKETKQNVEKFIYDKLPEAFLSAYKKLSKPELVLYDVPLLFERNLQNLVDVTIVVYAPRNLQRERLIVRDQNTIEMAAKILDQQIDIEAKKKMANFCINNLSTLPALDSEVETLLKQIME